MVKLSEVKLTKIIYEYSNGSKVEVNAEDIEAFAKALRPLLEMAKARHDAVKKS